MIIASFAGWVYEFRVWLDNVNRAFGDFTGERIQVGYDRRKGTL